MHENNPFQNIKDYWGSYYSTLTEGALKGLLNDMGYYFTDEGEHAGKWVHEKTGKALSDKHAMEIAVERANRKKKSKNKEADAAGPNPTDMDARAQDEESTRSEEVEHDGEQLDEKKKIMVPQLRGTLAGHMLVAKNRFSRGSKATGNKQRKREWEAAVGSVHSTPDTPESFRVNIGREAVRNSMNEQEGLFHKDSDRLLREHIRAEYEARGIYPTTREVQETFNHVVDLLEKTREGKRQAAHKARRNKPNGDDTEKLKGEGFSEKMLDLITTGTGR